MSKRPFIFSLILFFCIQSPIRADVIGSTSSVSAESHVIFPESPLVANEMSGFAWMKNGFTLTNENTACSFNALFPVSGTVNINGGTLTLDEDLHFQNTTTLLGGGMIIGNSHSLYLCSSISAIPSNMYQFQDTTIFCEGSLDFLSSITFSGSCAIVGTESPLVLNSLAGIYVDSDSELTIRNVSIHGVSDTNIQGVDDSAMLVLDNTTISLDDSWHWKMGALHFNNQVSLIGSSTFYYESVQTSTIDTDAILQIDSGMQVCMGRHSETGNDPLFFEDETSTLHLNNCSFVATDSGMVFTRGTLLLENEVFIDAVGTTTQTGIILGEGNADTDLTIFAKPGAALVHNSGYWVYNNAAKDKITSASKTARMIRNLNSLIYMPQDMQLTNISVELASSSVTPINVASGKMLSYKNAAIRLPDIDFDITSDQLNAYTYFLDGNDSLFLTKGVLPMYLLIAGAGNQLRGNGGLTGAITFEDNQTELYCGMNGFIDSALSLNGGTLLLDYDVLFRTNGAIYGPGTINVGNNYVEFSKEPFEITTPLYFIGNNGGVGLHGKVTLSSTWTFQGTCRLDGNGAKLILADEGGLYVAPDSELQLKNIRVTGISGENLSCIDDTGSIVLLESELVMSDDVALKKGALKFFLNNSLSGAYTFSYDSCMTSTVKSDARFTIGGNANLYIGRNAGNEPLYFEDESSLFKFEDSKLTVKNSGMQLTRGTLIASRDVEVDVLSTSTQTGLIFGDGTPSGDMNLVLYSASTARFTGGHLTYNMSRVDGIQSKSTTAQMIRSAASVFYLPQNLNLADLTIAVSPYSTLIVDEGKTLSYTNARVVNDQDEFYLTTTWYNFFTMLLSGNDVVNLSNGTLPLYLLVSGNDNRLEGVGNVGGVITLADSNSELACNLSGTILKSIGLNGGTISLDQNLKLGNNALFTGDGTVQMNSYDIAFGNTDVTWSDDVWWSGTNAVMSLNSNVSLAATWTFDGTCVIKGKGHTLHLGSSGNIIVNPDSQLLLQDIYIENIAGNNVRCMDDTGCIILKDMSWGQHPPKGQEAIHDYSFAFTTGAMQFQNQVLINGSALFAYETSQTSTIIRDSALIFDSGMTFSYAPDGDSRLFVLENENARFVLNGATLFITSTGMQLTKGIFEVTKDSDIVIDYIDQEDELGIISRSYGEFTLGDGSSIENDCVGKIDLGVSLRLKSGIFSYKNLASDSWSMGNQLSTFELYPGTILKLHSSLPLGYGRLLVSKYAHLDDQGGNDVVGTVAVVEDQV